MEMLFNKIILTIKKNNIILLLFSFLTFFIFTWDLYQKYYEYSKNFSYSLEIETTNNKFKSDPSLYFNNDGSTRIIGYINNKKIIFNNIPTNINNFNFRFNLPKYSKINISNVSIYLKCKIQKNCGKIFNFNISNNFEIWKIKGVGINKVSEIISIDNESTFFWGKQFLDLNSLATKKGYELINIDDLSLLFPVMTFLISLSTFFLYLISIKNNFLLLKKTVILIGSLLIFITYTLSAFPGHTNFDEFYSINEFWSGNLSDLHPPTQTLIWAGLMDLSNFFSLSKSLQTYSMLFCIIILFLLSLYLISTLIKTLTALILMYLFLIFSPFYLVYIPHIGKDTVLAISLLLSCIFLYFCNTRNFYYIIPAMFFLIIAYGSRSNAPAAVIPLIIYFAINFSYKIKKKKTQFIKKFKFLEKTYVFVPVFSLVMIIFTITPNNFINNIFIKNKCCAGSTALLTPMQDLMGMSYYSQKLLIPKIYLKDPINYLSHLNEYFYPPWNVNFDETQNINVSNTRHILLTWFNAIRENPELYLKNRVDILKRFFGFTSSSNPIAYSTGFYFNNFQNKSFNSIKASEKFSFKNQLDPALLIFQSFTKFYISKFKDTIFFKPWFYIFVVTIAILFFRRSNNLDQLIMYFFLSSFFYLAPYVLLVNSASIRYAFWPMLCSLFIIVLKLDIYLNCKKIN